jgi:hypothetical protein
VKIIEYLLIFLAGMLFFGYIVPLLDALIKMIVTWLEYPK